jgi:hypothetical protein
MITFLGCPARPDGTALSMKCSGYAPSVFSVSD